jgi:hypothetical protein
MMTTNEIVKKYGKPNETGEGYLTTILLPYPMKLAWDLDTKVSKMRCHKLAAEPFLNVFNDLLAQYGIKEIERLGIDLFGGCFNYRKMRGGTSWSKHAWGIAVDIDPGTKLS